MRTYILGVVIEQLLPVFKSVEFISDFTTVYRNRVDVHAKVQCYFVSAKCSTSKPAHCYMSIT